MLSVEHVAVSSIGVSCCYRDSATYTLMEETNGILGVFYVRYIEPLQNGTQS